MSLTDSVDNFHKALGNFVVTLGVFLMSWGLEHQGKKLEVMLRQDIKKIFLEGFEMGRDTKDLSTEEEVEWYDQHSLYEPEEAWVNSDAEEIIPPTTPEIIARNWRLGANAISTGVIEADTITAGVMRDEH